MRNRSVLLDAPDDSKAGKNIPPGIGPMSPDDTMLSAGAGICRELMHILRINSRGAEAGEDPEYVHRMRIAARKLRIVLQLWGQFLPVRKTDRLREEIKWLAGILGRARDADILEARFEKQWEGDLFSAPFKDFVRHTLRQNGTTAKKTLADALRSERYEQLLVSFEALFNRKPPSGEEHTLLRVVPQLFGFAVRKAARYAGRDLDNSELHALRITFKRLRYLAGFFSGLYGKRLEGCIRQFRKYQEMLGNHCDAQVAERFLLALVSEGVVQTPETNRHLLELGGLVYLQRRDAGEQRRRFDKKSPMLPGLLKEVRACTKRI